MPDPCYFVHVETDKAVICSGLHRAPLVPLLKGKLLRAVKSWDKHPGQTYRTDIICMNSGQQALIGEVRGPLSPMLTGEVMARALMLDAGKRLSKSKHRGARHADAR